MEEVIGSIGSIIFLVIIIVIIVKAVNKNKTTLADDTEDQDLLNETGLNITKQISGKDYSFVVDTKNKKFAIKTYDLDKYLIFNYKDLINYEIIEDGNSIQKGRSGSTLVGGALFGGIGALAGSARKKKTIGTCNTLTVHIIVNNIENPTCNIETIHKEVKKTSNTYITAKNKAQEIAALLNIIQTDNENSKSN